MVVGVPLYADTYEAWGQHEKAAGALRKLRDVALDKGKSGRRGTHTIRQADGTVPMKHHVINLETLGLSVWALLNLPPPYCPSPVLMLSFVCGIIHSV
jgi:hypothetical protein